MNHDAARAIVYRKMVRDDRDVSYMAYGPRAFFAPSDRAKGNNMKTFVCQIEWPDAFRDRGDIPVGIVTQTFALVNSLVDKLRCDKGWAVEAAFSDRFKNYKLLLEKMQQGASMAQRLFTMEVRCDFRDPAPGEADPIELVKTIMQQAGRHIYSSAGLLGDRVKPTIVIYSHDWFKGHIDIPLFDDDIARGNVAITEAENVLAPEANVLTAVHLNPPVTASVTQPLTNSTAAEGEPAGLFSSAMLASLK